MADLRYLVNVFTTPRWFQRVNERCGGSTRTRIARGELGKIAIAVPPLPEQHAIAEALSDVDGLLGGLDRLIAKKRDLKQAAMQQLLTGQTRLPGFTGDWEVKTFGEIAFPRRDRIDPEQAGARSFCIELEHIESGTGHLLGSTTTGKQSSLKSAFDPGDVLFGKLRAYLRKYWRATRSGVCSTEIWVLVSKNEAVTSEFLFQIIQTDEFIDAASDSYGTHMPRSDWNVVKNYNVRVPPVSEQTAIAEVLSEMDAELAALEQRREKTRALKQAMMQELLTGRTRLV
jgi:type I restriction enzyme S subunit